MKTFPVGLEDEQRAELQKAADAAGKSLAAWMRETCLLAARGELVPTAASLGRLADAPTGPVLLGPESFKGTDFKPEKKEKKR